MTQEEIIRMAREAGLFIAHDSEGQFSAVHDGEILDMYPDGDKERDRLYREKRFVEILGPFSKLVAAKAAEKERQWLIDSGLIGVLKHCEDLLRENGHDDAVDDVQNMIAKIKTRGQANG